MKLFVLDISADMFGIACAHTFASILLDHAFVSGLSICAIFLLLLADFTSLELSIAALLGHDCFLRPEDVLLASPLFTKSLNLINDSFKIC